MKMNKCLSMFSQDYHKQKSKPKIDPMTGQPMIDESGQVINEILFDLTKFEFDIKVEPSEMTPTMQQAMVFQFD